MEMSKCPDCKGELEKGCFIDLGYGSVTVQRYARGEVSDTKNKVVMGANEEKFYDVRRVVTYRCTQCNRLYSYALNTITVPNVGARTGKMLLIFFGIMFVTIVLVVLIGLASS